MLLKRKKTKFTMLIKTFWGKYGFRRTETQELV